MVPATIPLGIILFPPKLFFSSSQDALTPIPGALYGSHPLLALTSSVHILFSPLQPLLPLGWS